MKYRKEIDGLRALAVIPVILFHAGFTTFSGGFVGVDIFFVISGYLITTIIVDELEKGSFSLLNFYERRARRILPALFFVMLCTIPFAWFFMIPRELSEYSKSLISVPLFVSNIVFWLDSGYFSQASELKPLLHTWSLAVEEQYYVLFPLFLILAWNLGKKWIFSLLFLAAILSILSAQWGSSAHPSLTYFILPTRGFEILIGALISLLINYKSSTTLVSQSVSQSVSLVGLILIFYAIFAFNKNTPSPSLYTLVPTIGAGFILVFANNKNLVGKMLGNKLLVGIGLISYSSYLWHQPLLAFAKLRSFDNLSTTSLIILCFFSLALGYISWKFVEKPYRDRKIIPLIQIIKSILTFAILFIAIGLTGYLAKGFPNRFNIPNEVAKMFIGNNIREYCDLNYNDDGKSIEFCELGDKSQKKIDLAIFGDSHSGAVLPAFDKIGKDISKKYTHIGLGGCPPFIGVDVAKGNYAPKVCEDLAYKQFEFVKLNNIKKVFLVGRWSLYTEGDYNGLGIYYLITEKNTNLDKDTSRINFKESSRNTIEKYQAIGVQVFVMAQIPQQKINPEVLYLKLYSGDHPDKQEIINSVSITKKDHLSLQKYNREVFESFKQSQNFTYINLDNSFCDGEKCYIGSKIKSNYLDENHLSINGALYLSETIKKYIEKY